MKAKKKGGKGAKNKRGPSRRGASHRSRRPAEKPKEGAHWTDAAADAAAEFAVKTVVKVLTDS
jgi:hypothetical protein